MDGRDRTVIRDLRRVSRLGGLRLPQRGDDEGYRSQMYKIIEEPF